MNNDPKKDRRIKLLTINGVSNKGIVDVVAATGAGQLFYNTGGSCSISSSLPKDDIKVTNFIIDQHKKQLIDFSYVLKHDLVFCEIADPDSHSVALSKAQALHRKTYDKIKWINNPSLVARTTRDKVSRLLANLPGVIAPRTLRLSIGAIEDLERVIDSKKVTLPILLRPSGSHGGAKLVLVKHYSDLDEIDLSLYGDAYVTEFIDYRFNDIYTKYRFAVVRGQPIVRHVISSDSSIIHSRSREFMAANPEYQQKERNIIERFEQDLKLQISDTVFAIWKIIGLDYFGIDCAIKDGQVILFEVNANMNILFDNQPKPNIWEGQIEAIIKTFVVDLIRCLGAS